MGVTAASLVLVHLRPVQHIGDAPKMRVLPRETGRPPAGQEGAPFDRRYEIVSRDMERARALVTDEVHQLTVRQDLVSWWLRDQMLIVQFDGMGQPASLHRRLPGLVRLAKAVTGTPAA
ncbi:hypothetical protein [Streptomyces sp. TP-A0874]|uniref:hypothetical protein n=1 Tax=Streptomyces sp. TP-A0874 TaxID=549819 RepID=UPI0008531E8E|nr:hypothetical protein [Streptomyces sp. TP-A0874]